LWKKNIERLTREREAGTPKRDTPTHNKKKKKKRKKKTKKKQTKQHQNTTRGGADDGLKTEKRED